MCGRRFTAGGKVDKVGERVAVAIASPVFWLIEPETVTGLPSCVLPLKNVTVPVGGFPKLCVVMVAVSVTLPPDAMLVGLAAAAVVVDACEMLIISLPELALKLLSPEYVA